jgi:hypothetical protein
VLILHGFLFLVIVTFVYYLPGRMLYALLPSGKLPEETFAVSLGLGLLAVNVPAIAALGLLGLYFPLFMRWYVVVAVSIGASGILGFLLWQKGRLNWRTLIPWPGRGQWALAGLTAFATLFFLVHFDFDLLPEDSCVVRAATAISVYYGGYRAPITEDGGPPAPDAFLRAIKRHPARDNRFITANQGQRLGPSVLVAPLVALFGSFGFRLVYALQGLLLPGLGFALGWYVLRRRSAAWAVATVLTFSPYALELQGFDENIMSSIFGTLMFVLLLRERPAFFAAGMALSMFLGIRHVGVVMVPAVLAFLWWQHRRDRDNLLQFVQGTALFAAPYLMLHYFVWSDMGHLFEGAIERPPAPHSFFGIEFNLSVLLNWPFVLEPVRSPYSAFPPLVAFPLDFVRRWSWPVMALIPAGVVWMFTKRRARALLFVGWFMPLMALLMVQSNWSEPNKMGIPATASAVLVLFLVAGVMYLTNRGIDWRFRITTAAIGIALPALLVPLLKQVDAPYDWRVYGALPSYVTEPLVDVPFGTVLRFDEDERYVSWDRERYGLKLVPDLAFEKLHIVILKRRLEQFVVHLQRPWISQYEAPLFTLFPQAVLGSGRYVGPVTRFSALVRQETDEPGVRRVKTWPQKSVTPGPPMCISLSSPTSLSTTPLRPCPDQIEEPLQLTGGELFQVRGYEVDWADNPVNLLLGRDQFGTVFLGVMPPGIPEPLTNLSSVPVTNLSAEDYPDLLVPLSLPRGEVIRLLEMRSMNPSRLYQRYIVIDQDDSIWVSDGRPTSLK